MQTLIEKNYKIKNYYSVIRKNEILTFATMWIDLENITLGEISQSEKVNNHKISLICGI